QNCIIALDKVSGLGEFVEIEAAATENFDQARKNLLALLETMGLSRSHIEPRSYFEMVSEM
ncbi:MAG: class IV adenylate cyclase, partial [Candidatus Korarchaeota archaeon]